MQQKLKSRSGKEKSLFEQLTILFVFLVDNGKSDTGEDEVLEKTGATFQSQEVLEDIPALGMQLRHSSPAKTFSLPEPEVEEMLLLRE